MTSNQCNAWHWFENSKPGDTQVSRTSPAGSRSSLSPKYHGTKSSLPSMNCQASEYDEFRGNSPCSWWHPQWPSSKAKNNPWKSMKITNLTHILIEPNRTFYRTDSFTGPGPPLPIVPGPGVHRLCSATPRNRRRQKTRQSIWMMYNMYMTHNTFSCSYKFIIFWGDNILLNPQLTC